MTRSYNPDLSSDAIANAGSDFKRSAETVIDKTSESAQTVLGGLSQTADEIAAAAKPAVNRLIDSGGALARDAMCATRDAADKAKQSAGRAVEKAGTYVSEQPLRSIAIAAAVGAVVAALVLVLRSRRDYY